MQRLTLLVRSNALNEKRKRIWRVHLFWVSTDDPIVLTGFPLCLRAVNLKRLLNTIPYHKCEMSW